MNELIWLTWGCKANTVVRAHGRLKDMIFLLFLEGKIWTRSLISNRRITNNIIIAFSLLMKWLLLSRKLIRMHLPGPILKLNMVYRCILNSSRHLYLLNEIRFDTSLLLGHILHLLRYHLRSTFNNFFLAKTKINFLKL